MGRESDVHNAVKRFRRSKVLTEVEKTVIGKHVFALGKILGFCLMACFAYGYAEAADPPSISRGETMTSSFRNNAGDPPSGLLPYRAPFAEGEEYELLLDGPPQTCGLRCGRVVLKPEETAGEHTTGQYEEVLVILEGKGELWFQDFPSVVAEKGYLLYVPPQAVHDVRNTGTVELRYLYIVAPVAEKKQ
jgi:mannose-6-phosphate isomerase-like protein (cupin superfamily)